MQVVVQAVHPILELEALVVLVVVVSQVEMEQVMQQQLQELPILAVVVERLVETVVSLEHLAVLV
jgi:hypothetical protein